MGRYSKEKRIQAVEELAVKQAKDDTCHQQAENNKSVSLDNLKQKGFDPVGHTVSKHDPESYIRAYISKAGKLSRSHRTKMTLNDEMKAGKAWLKFLKKYRNEIL